MPNIGPTELVIVLVIALLVLGPKRLPAAGRSLGHGIREFKDSVTGRDRPGTAEIAPAAAPVADDVPAQAPTRR
jgi:sec-independent protein translocase protein TatA